jgi:hypothetical protein
MWYLSKQETVFGEVVELARFEGVNAIKSIPKLILEMELQSPTPKPKSPSKRGNLRGI